MSDQSNKESQQQQQQQQQPTSSPQLLPLTDSELNTILHGLRMVQEVREAIKGLRGCFPYGKPSKMFLSAIVDQLLDDGCLINEMLEGNTRCACDHFDSCDDLTETQIDDLCERLNLDRVFVLDREAKLSRESVAAISSNLTAVPYDLSKMDWKLLREQKRDLAEIADNMHGVAIGESLQGILCLIDWVQDTPVEAGVLSAQDVFGEPEPVAVAAVDPSDSAIDFNAGCITVDSQAYQRDLLRTYFPWLGTDQAVSGADVVDRLVEWYQAIGGEGVSDGDR